MMKRISILPLLFLLLACQPKVKKEDLAKVNGYWEIKEVTLDNGEKKEYKVNETIDYFEVKDNAGFRQKVMPQFDGKFKTNGIKEDIQIVDNDGTYYIEYRTAYGSWKEAIVVVEDSVMVLKNKQNLTYTYKKFKPFSLK